MKKLFYLSISFLLLFVGTNSIKADWIEPAQYQQMLGSGIDVDWWTDGNTYASQDWDNVISDFGKAGIQHVRITLSKNYMSPDDFMLLDRQVNICIRNGITPIIAYQPGFSGRFTLSQRARIAQWWQDMAEHYRNYPARLSFDILLEPNSSMFATYDELNRFYDDCVSAIRISNPYRIVFIAPTYNSDPMYLQYLRIPSRANGYLMAEWHFLSRNNYRSFWNRWNTRRAYEQRWLNARIETALAWQRRTGIYTWVGGWAPGIYVGTSYTTAPESLTEYLCAALLRASLPYAVCDVHHFYNYRTHTWHENARRPMQQLFRGNFARSGMPTGPSPSRGGGFSIGGRRFGGQQQQAMRPNNFRNERPGNGFSFNGSGNNRRNDNQGIRFGGNGRSGNTDRYVQTPNRQQNNSRSDMRNGNAGQRSFTGSSMRNEQPNSNNYRRDNVQSRPNTQTNRPQTQQSVRDRNQSQRPNQTQTRTSSQSNTQKSASKTDKQTERRGGGGFARGNNRQQNI